jgi:hypothetical protein
VSEPFLQGPDGILYILTDDCRRYLAEERLFERMLDLADAAGRLFIPEDFVLQ